MRSLVTLEGERNEKTNLLKFCSLIPSHTELYWEKEQRFIMSKASSNDSQMHISHLQLDDLSVLRVLDDGTVAGKLFFQRLDDAFFVKLLRDSLSQK